MTREPEGDAGWNSFERDLAATFARHADDPFRSTTPVTDRRSPRWRLVGVAAAAVLLLAAIGSYRLVAGIGDGSTVIAADPGGSSESAEDPTDMVTEPGAALTPSTPTTAIAPTAVAEMDETALQPPEPMPIDPVWLTAASAAGHGDARAYFNRAVGTTERQGRIFFGTEAGLFDDCPVGVSTPVFALGTGDPILAGSIPGRSVARLRVSWAGNGFATAWCGDTTIFWSAKFDGDTFDLSTARAWTVDGGTDFAAPIEWVSAREVRWGVWTLDLPTGVWTCDPAPDVVSHHGTSDSGRFFYWSATGPQWESVGASDAPSPDARVLVTDAVTGQTREVADSNLGVDADVGFLLGPADEVAWITGDELGSAAFLGRIDWSTGELTEAWRLFSGPDAPYWGHPDSGSGDPGPDGIAFEADGTLRAWAYTNTEGNRAHPRVETLTYRLDELAGSTAQRLPSVYGDVLDGLSLSERAQVIGEVNVGGDTWIASQVSTTVRQRLVGESFYLPSGRRAWPEFSELLRVDDGLVVEAIPINGFPLTGIAADDRYVVVYRRGDGGSPHSGFLRLDTATGEIERLMVPVVSVALGMSLADAIELHPDWRAVSDTTGDALFGALAAESAEVMVQLNEAFDTATFTDGG